MTLIPRQLAAGSVVYCELNAKNTFTQAVDNITDMNLQIASATEEQSNMARGIDANIVIIRDISVETARSAEQVSSSSEKVVALADKVQGLVNQFRV